MIGINYKEDTDSSTSPQQPATKLAMAPTSSDIPFDPLQSTASSEQDTNASIENGSPKLNKAIVSPTETSPKATQVSGTISLQNDGSEKTLDTSSIPTESSITQSEANGSENPENTQNKQDEQDKQKESGSLEKEHEARPLAKSDTSSLVSNLQADKAQPIASGVNETNQEQKPSPKLKRPPLRPIDLDSVPKKSILKKETSYPFIEQPVKSPIFKSQWLQSTVNRLAVMSGPAQPTAYTANSPSMFRKLVTQATTGTLPPSTLPSTNYSRLQKPAGPPVFANNEQPLPHLESQPSSSSLLSDNSLKRVRFSVGKLTTEHIFHNDDAYESAEESESQKKQQIDPPPAQPKKLLTTSDGVVVDDNIYTAREITNYYLVACIEREEEPIDRLVNEMHAASSRLTNPLLTSIDISGEPLSRKALEPICDILSLEFGLKQLYLDNCSLEDDTLKMLLYSLLLTDTLTVLSIQDNKKIKSNGFKYASVFVKKTKSLKSLNISGITADKRSVEFLAHALRVGRLGFGSRLQELRMDRCGLRGNLLEIMAPAIRESNLKVVSLRSNRIGSAGGVWLGVLMRDYEDQPNATIPNNNDEQGFKRVFPGISNPELLKRTHGVEVLDISDNDLRQGADYVAQTLRRNMSLKSLIMTDNTLDPARLAILADALKLNIGLESLDLSNNRICGPLVTGVNALIQKLAFNRTLTKLTLSNTGLQSEGAIALAEFLPETRTLTQLDLTGNDLVDIAGVMALSVSIRINKSLTCLDMNVPPNDAEFARLSRDILRACIRNMEEKTGSNAGMPSPDGVLADTIFRQPSSPIIPELASHSPEDKRWLLLETVAGELYRTRDTLNAMEKALNHEKSMRRNWLEHFYRKSAAAPLTQIASTNETEQSEGTQESPAKIPVVPIPSTPEEQKMLEVAQGVLYRGPPQIEQLYHQCKRHQANIVSLNARIDNDKALQELENMFNLLNVFMEAYRGLFALPEMPTNVVVAKRTNSLPPLEPANGPASTTNSNDNPEVESAGEVVQEEEIGQEQVVPEVLTEEPISEIDSTFLLEDDDDLDDEVYTNDALIDVRRTSLRRSNSGSSSSDEQSPESPSSNGERGLKPTPLNTTGDKQTDGERSPSILASPLEMLRKATEVEEGEALRRGKDLLENEAESPTAESPTIESPTIESPTIESPTVESPTVESPK
ncbi:hypothetical protein BGZ46_003230 [Entomortierella lignicola]|nr:hypothetical protein BGZ46_003230 [Entomortierella lignicola]